MSNTRLWLIDKSALVKLGRSPESDTWAGRIERGLVHIATVTMLEVGHSERDARSHLAARNNPPLASMPLQNMTPKMESRAVEVQYLLAQRGQHRMSIPDVLIAAIAEAAGLIVLHDDKDYQLIAEVTGQPVERLALS